jgi:hypothetical protein
MAFSLVANPHLPIQQLPGYAGFSAVPMHETAFYEITAYEPLKAVTSYLTGLPLLYSYYLLVPALMSAVTVIVTYRLLRELIPRGWIIGMLFFFVVMVAWGDVHRTLANFGFVRMFQGKSVFVSAVVPALFLYSFLIKKSFNAQYHRFLLASVFISGIGFSRGAVIIGLLALFVLAVASIDFNKLEKYSTKLLIVIVVSGVVISPVAYHYGWTIMNPSQVVYTSKGDVMTTTNLEMIEFTMGDGIRGIFLLMCVVASFLFVKDEDVRYSYRNFLVIFFILLVIPWTSNFFAKTIQEYLSWRWMWITPVPVLASVTVGGALTRVKNVSNSAVAVGVFVVLAVGFTAASPKRVISPDNCTSIHWPGPKLDSDSIYLRPQQKAAAVKNGNLYLEGYEEGF